MKARDIGAVACKVIAIYVFVVGLEMSCQYIGAYSYTMIGAAKTSRDWEHILLMFAPLVFQAIVAGVLWFTARRIGAKMAPREEADAPVSLETGPRPAEDIMTLSFAVVGLVLLAWGILNLFHALSALALKALTKPPGPGESFGYDWAAFILARLPRPVIGAVLLFKARNFSRAVVWLRTAGHKDKTAQGET